MALSYLGIELLPKDIIAACKKAGGSEGICYNYDWGTAKRYTFTNSSSMKNFLQAVDNYLNGGGVYSPPHHTTVKQFLLYETALCGGLGQEKRHDLRDFGPTKR